MTKAETHKAFDESLNDIVGQREQYVENPQRDFVRVRKEPMDTVMNMLVYMSSGDTMDEIEDFFEARGPAVHVKDDVDAPGQSAFSQQRKKLKAKAVEDLFHRFVRRLNLKMDEEEQGRLDPAFIPVIGDGTSLRYESAPAYSGAVYRHAGKSGGGWYEQKLTAIFSPDRQLFMDGIVHGVTDGSEPRICAPL